MWGRCAWGVNQWGAGEVCPGLLFTSAPAFPKVQGQAGRQAGEAGVVLPGSWSWMGREEGGGGAKPARQARRARKRARARAQPPSTMFHVPPVPAFFSPKPNQNHPKTTVHCLSKSMQKSSSSFLVKGQKGIQR